MSHTNFMGSQLFGDQCLDEEKLVENAIRQEQSNANVNNAGQRDTQKNTPFYGS